MAADQLEGGSATAASGHAACDATDGQPCRLRWHLEGDTESPIWIERLDAPSGNWLRVGGPKSERSGVTSDPVPGGHLYRVVACDDHVSKGDPGSCIGTSVHWVPIWPAGPADLPDFVLDGRGTRMVVAKKGSLGGRTQQLNVYLIERLLNDLEDGRYGMSLAAMPPMTRPAETIPTPSEFRSDDAFGKHYNHVFIQHYAYRAFEARRNSVR